MTPAAHNPDSPKNAPQTPTPGPLRAEIQTPGPVAYLPTERPHTASPDQHGTDQTSLHTATAVLTTPMFGDYDVQDFSDSGRVESVPVRGDILIPMLLPPLPTTRSKPAHLDISHGGEEGGQVGSGRGDSSGSGEGGSTDDSSSGAVVGAMVTPTQVWAETTSRPSWLLETTTGSEQGRPSDPLEITPRWGLGMETTSRPSELLEMVPDRVTPGPGLGMETTSKPSQLLGITPVVVIPEILTPEPGLPAVTGEVGQQPAVVFKDDATPGATPMFDPNQTLPIPVDGDSTAKPPFHLIIVDLYNQNHSGE